MKINTYAYISDINRFLNDGDTSSITLSDVGGMEITGWIAVGPIEFELDFDAGAATAKALADLDLAEEKLKIELENRLEAIKNQRQKLTAITYDGDK